MNKLEMRNTYKVFEKLRDIRATFLFSLFLCQTFFLSSTPDFRPASDSNNRPVSLQTKLGSIFIHFQGAATAVRERVRVGKEWGCICMLWCEKCGWSQARYNAGKTKSKNTRRDRAVK